MATQILRNIVGRLLGLGPQNELIMAGSKILYGHGANLDAQVDLVSAPQVLLLCATPFIEVSSGSMANNGALSGITALRQTYAACWVILPANAIFAGSAAGAYFCVMASTTTGQVFNVQPTLVGNQIPIPANPTPFVSTGPGAFTQTTAASVVAFTLVLPGNSMGAHGSVKMKGLFSCNSSASTKIGQFIFGASATGGASNTTNLGQPVEHEIRNRGFTNSQVVEAGGGYLVSAGAPLEAANDTTAPMNLTFNLQLATVATDTCQWDAMRIDLVRSP